MNRFRYLPIAFIAFIPAIAIGQTNEDMPSPTTHSSCEMHIDSLKSHIDSLVMINKQLLDQLYIDIILTNRYKLYKTENMYNLLQLDTQTGKIEQVQWSLKSEKEGTFTINDKDLSYYGQGPGTFELYPTNNMYQFILIDKSNGRKWHVQWGTEGYKSRWIRRIY